MDNLITLITSEQPLDPPTLITSLTAQPSLLREPIDPRQLSQKSLDAIQNELQ